MPPPLARALGQKLWEALKVGRWANPRAWHELCAPCVCVCVCVCLCVPCVFQGATGLAGHVSELPCPRVHVRED